MKVLDGDPGNDYNDLQRWRTEELPFGIEAVKVMFVMWTLHEKILSKMVRKPPCLEYQRAPPDTEWSEWGIENWILDYDIRTSINGTESPSARSY